MNMHNSVSVSSQRRVVITLLGLFILLLPIAMAGGETGYSITFNGNPVQPEVHSLNGTPDDPQPGDVVWINHDVPLVLGEERRLELSGNIYENGLIYQETPEGKIPIGASVEYKYRNSQKVLSNPVANMTPAQMAKLRGLVINAPLEELGQSLSSLKLDQTVICIRDSRTSEPIRFSSLPENVEYLIIQPNSARGMNDFSFLQRLSRLRCLYFSLIPHQSFDIRHISGAQDLRYITAHK